jgi:integrase
MTQKLTVARIDSLTPRFDCKTGKTKAKDVTDGSGTGLLVRVQPSGRKYYYVQFRRPAHVKKQKSGEVRYEINTTRVRLGRTDHIGLNKARILAKEATNAARGAVSAGLTGDDVRQVVNQQLLRLDKTPAEMTKESEHQRKCPTAREFIDEIYGPYKKVENKYFADGRELARLKHVLNILGDDSTGSSSLNLLDQKLFQIDSNLIRAWMTKRQNSPTARTKRIPSRVTVSRELNMMRAMFKHAATCGLIKANPLGGIQLKAKSTRKIDPLTDAEEDRLLAALLDREKVLRANGSALHSEGEFADFLRPVILLAMHTGMRFGEIASLTWENVDISNTGEMRSQVWLPITKNGEPHSIPLNDFAVIVLDKWWRQCANLDKGAYVFTDYFGKKLIDIRRFWHPVFQKAGLPKGYRFHDFRHHFASKLVMSGVPLFAVQSLLNHGSPQMTQRYAKFAPEWMQQTVGKLSEEAKWTL